MTRIQLWSCPRNLSTALMYSFAQRADCTVVDEPFYGHYLQFSGVDHPGRDEVLATMETDGEKVVQQMMGPFPTPLVFFKQMTHHLGEVKEDFMADCLNLIFIRDPREIIASYGKVIPRPTMRDIGVQEQFDLFQRLQKRGLTPLILDALPLRKNPEATLRQLCADLGIAFAPNMLSWKAGARAEDGIWAKYWYTNLHSSTGFQAYEPREIHLTDYQENLAREAEEYYLFLREQQPKQGESSSQST
ncbi:MAG: hypothetical protein H6581_21255 [Bacteroidia bacterium]|nr:hypothetical protein [Bacteroidia bacterium]